tara:strand:+ start:700 stop:1719 length:1020 start_codon:yes stop_codon:yes gene_type:complete
MALSINGTTGISGIDGSASAPALKGTDNNTGISFGTDLFKISTAGGTRATIDSTGKLGLGIDAPTRALHINSDEDLTSFTGTTKGALCLSNSDYASGDYSAIDFTYSGSANPLGRIATKITGSGSTLSFGTSNNYSNGITNEAFFIDPNGRTKVNTNTNVSTASAEQFASDAGTSGGYGGVFASNTSGGFSTIYCKTGTNVSNFIYFYRDTSLVGSITTNGSSVSYNTSSDYRLKENAVAISDGITRLKTLKPYRFNWKADPSTTVDGFFAHEVTAVPEAVTGTKDQISTEKDGAIPKGDPIYQTIDQSKLVPLLTAALQEAIAKIEVLETKVAALEAG